MNIDTDPRFSGLQRFEKKVWLASPKMHGEEQKWVDEAIQTNWVSTVGANINEIEKQFAEYVGVKAAVALSAGTASLHLAARLAAEKLYGQPRTATGMLAGKKVFCSDTTFAASVNPRAYEDGEAVFIDSEEETWNMDPEALKKAFEIYPDVKLIVLAHLYGTPAKAEEIRKIADEHGALIIEDAAEALGAKCLIDGKWVTCGAVGDYNCISFNGNKIITGSSGGMFLTDSIEDANKVRKWSTQSREAAPWYQHEEVGYNYRMSNIIAGIVRGQFPHLGEHIAKKKEIWERYEKGLSDLPIKMNYWEKGKAEPNYWLSCMTINEDAMCQTVRSDSEALYHTEAGKSCPAEILEALAAFNAEGRPIWKPMHMQPIYMQNPFITKEGNGRGRTNAYIAGSGIDCGADIFRRGLCLPSDVNMTNEQQDIIIDIIHRCFQ